MGLFSKRPALSRAAAYPNSEYKPVIRQSICTGEKTACMKHIATGRLTEIMLIKTDADLDAFCRDYGVDRRYIETVY